MFAERMFFNVCLNMYNIITMWISIIKQFILYAICALEHNLPTGRQFVYIFHMSAVMIVFLCKCFSDGLCILAVCLFALKPFKRRCHHFTEVSIHSPTCPGWSSSHGHHGTWFWNRRHWPYNHFRIKSLSICDRFERPFD